MDTNELLNLGLNFCKRLEEDRGYDRVSLEYMGVKPDGSFKIVLNHIDTFQDRLEYGQRYYSESFKTLRFTFAHELDQLLHDWPSRGQREFEVLARRCAGLRGISDQLVSAAGLAFHAEIVKTLDKYRLLEAPKVGEEIPF